MLYYWYSFAIFFTLHLPLSISYQFATGLAYCAYFFNRRLRQTIQSHLANLIQATGQPLDINRVTKDSLVNFFKYLVDFFRVPLLTKEYIKANIPIYGIENLDNAIAQGKRIIILSGHIGNWELGAIVMAKLGYRITTIALDHRNPRVNKLFLYRRKSAGVRVFPPSITAVRECYQALEINRLVGLLGDLEFGTGGLELDWLGETLRVPKGPAMLARRTGAVVIPVVMIRQKDDQLVIYIDTPIPPDITDNPEKDIMINTRKYLAALGKYIQQYPDQWYRFR
ncbi:MAG: lysophospholipid acyltransferase family protein [bacterium]|nr:lysophospholipid acyltransferase family protein [bacterium]